MTKDERYAIRQPLTRQSERQKIIEHCGTKCVNCGSEVNIQYHHIVPLECGGRPILSNTVALCAFCHCLAHSKQIRKGNYLKSGRKPMPKPDNADQVIQDYLTGCIGMKELKKELNLKPGLKTTDLWYFKDFLKDHHIAKYINFHDILVSPHSIKNSMQQDFVTLAVITYENGEEDVFFGEPNVLFRKGELNHEWHES